MTSRNDHEWYERFFKKYHINLDTTHYRDWVASQPQTDDPMCAAISWCFVQKLHEDHASMLRCYIK
jgi:hypothetical protein